MRSILALACSVIVASTASAQNKDGPVEGPPKGDTSAKRDDFAYGLKVEAEGEHALQRLVLPEQVYEALTRPDASDLAVFNLTGSQVPHALKRTSESLKATPDVKLAVFPLRGATPDALSAMTISVNRAENGAVSTVITDSPNSGSNVLVGYLIDTSTIEQSVRALTFGWAPSESSLVQYLYIESSDDLTYWSTIANNTVARLVQDGQRIEKERIEFPPVHAKYLRVSWTGHDAPPIALTQVTATLTASITEPARSWANVFDVTAQSSSNFRIHVKGTHPVDRLRISLPENNTVAQATVSSAKTTDGPWSTRFTGLVYRFDERDIGSTTIPVDDVDDAFWQIEVSSQGGGIGNGTPQVEIGWLPHELVFVQRGKGPFTVAYGDANKRIAAFDPQALINIARGTGDETVGNAYVQSAQLELGGASRLTPEPPDASLPIRRLILWGSLGAAVLVLAWMSIRLFKQMGST